ncbi:MAG TPA: SDR family oxidoreductase [Candidatus Angelobacter sp.]|nr:SDR family oxidoreductase [Candidatus Angelobacter sp.]
MESGLRGKRCLITGGNTGIGFGIAKALATEGVELAVAGLTSAPEALKELQNLTKNAFFLKVDVSEERAVVEMVYEALRFLGGVDLFVNNAAWAWHEPVTRISSENFYRTVNTNLAACVWACREVARHMIPRRSGSILIIGSTVRFCPAYSEAAYRISKMGLKMYMETLAIELAPYGIRVNMLTPGHHRTQLTSGIPPQIEAKLIGEIPLRRFGDPSECGPAAAFLLSDRLASYITGAEIVVDGGLALRPLPLRTDEEILKMNHP